MWSMKFHLGEKIGEENYFRADGTRVWTKTYGEDGEWTWVNFDAAGKKVATSKWRGKTLLSSDVPDAPAAQKAESLLKRGFSAVIAAWLCYRRGFC